MSASPGRIVEVVHLEDEPREIYDALTGGGLGLVLGARLEVLDRTDRGVHIEFRGRSWIVDSVKASNVTVRELPDGARPDETPTTLLEAAPGETVRVCAIAQACQGTQRRRLLDLGVVRGAAVTSELVSASGDPVAYRIRGALIALRRSQAAHVLVEMASGDHAGPGQDHDDGHHGIEEVA